MVTKRTISQFRDLDISYSFWLLVPCQKRLSGCLSRVVAPRLSQIACYNQLPSICVVKQKIIYNSNLCIPHLQSLYVWLMVFKQIYIHFCNTFSPKICWVLIFFFFNLFTQNQISIVRCNADCHKMSLLPAKLLMI